MWRNCWSFVNEWLNSENIWSKKIHISFGMFEASAPTNIKHVIIQIIWQGTFNWNMFIVTLLPSFGWIENGSSTGFLDISLLQIFSRCIWSESYITPEQMYCQPPHEHGELDPKYIVSSPDPIHTNTGIETVSVPRDNHLRNLQVSKQNSFSSNEATNERRLAVDHCRNWVQEHNLRTNGQYPEAVYSTDLAHKWAYISFQNTLRIGSIMGRRMN